MTKKTNQVPSRLAQRTKAALKARTETEAVSITTRSRYADTGTSLHSRVAFRSGNPASVP
jgi:hypothetical protein